MEKQNNHARCSCQYRDTEKERNKAGLKHTKRGARKRVHRGQGLIRGCWRKEGKSKSTDPCLNNSRESQLGVSGQESRRGGALETTEQE